MPEVTDLMRVAQYVKSNRDAPSDVYNAACRLLDEQAETQKRIDWLRGHAEWLSNDRDALKATVKNVKALRDIWSLLPGLREEADALDAALESPEKDAESPGDGRTPQTLGASEGQAASGAQEAAQ